MNLYLLSIHFDILMKEDEEYNKFSGEISNVALVGEVALAVAKNYIDY